MTLNGSAEKLQFWRGLLNEQPSSGLTVKAFCDAKGVSVPSFYSWRRKIVRDDSASHQAVSRNDPGLVPVTVIDPPKHQATEVVDSQCIEIVTPSGFSLRVGRDLPAETVAQLLHAIESCRRGDAAC
jgi:hypothetical protein